MSRSGMFAMMTAHGAVAAAGIQIVQKKGFASTVNNTTHSITLNSAPTNGNLLIVLVVADDVVTSFTGFTQDVANIAGNAATYIYSKVAGASESATISVTINASDTCSLYVYEISGLSSKAIDKSSAQAGQGAGAVMDTGTTAATTVANEFAVVLGGIWTNAGTQAITAWSNSFTLDQSLQTSNSGNIDNVALGAGHKILSATGTQQSTATVDSTVGLNNTAMIATYK